MHNPLDEWREAVGGRNPNTREEGGAGEREREMRIGMKFRSGIYINIWIGTRGGKGLHSPPQLHVRGPENFRHGPARQIDWGRRARINS